MQQREPRTRGGSERVRILVVDDDSSVLTLLSSVLNAGGYDCVTASSGYEALALVRSNSNIHVAISDIKMPGMDGIAFLQNLVSQPLHAPRVIFLTAHQRVNFAVAALRLGAADFLTKPVSPSEILNAVSRVLDRVHHDRMPAQVTDQVATLTEQVEVLVSALRGWTHPRWRHSVQDSHSGAAADKANAASGRSELALLGLDHLRRSRRSLAPLNELDDIAWDLLLELLRAEKSGRRFSVSALSISLEHIAPTTAMRRIQELVKGGHVLRIPDPRDARRDFLSLGSGSRAALERYLEHVANEVFVAPT